MNENPYEDKKEKENNINDEIENHNKQILKYLEKIKDKKSSNSKKKELYELILKLNNVEEIYIIPYLSLIKEMANNNEISKDHYNELLQKYSIYTEKEQKTENFQDLNFKNNFYKENDSQDIKSKINNFLESLKDKSEKSEKSDKSDSDDAIIKSQKTQFIYLIFKSIRNIKKTDYKAIKQVSWKNNPKLYLYIIYCSLVYSLYNRIEYYINKDSHNKKLFEMEDYNNCIDNINIINEEIKKTEEEKNKKKDEIKQIVIDLKEKINKILE